MDLSEKHKMIYNELHETLEKVNKHKINYSQYLLPYMESYKKCKLKKEKNCSEIFSKYKNNLLENKADFENNDNFYYECLNENFKEKNINSKNFNEKIKNCSNSYLKKYFVIKKKFPKKFN